MATQQEQRESATEAQKKPEEGRRLKKGGGGVENRDEGVDDVANDTATDVSVQDEPSMGAGSAEGGAAAAMAKTDDGSGLRVDGDGVPGAEGVVEDHEEGAESDLSGDGGVLKKILRVGTGNTPAYGKDEVTVHYVGTLASDGSQFDSSVDRGKPFRFRIGRGDVIRGWEIGVAAMRVGEKALLTVASDYGYGAGGCGSSIPPDATLKFEVELLSTRPAPKELWNMTSDEKLQVASDQKEEGNAAFKSGDFITAIAHYTDALEKLKNCDEWQESLAGKASALQLSLHLNVSNSYCRTQQWAQAIQAATEALRIDSSNSKALYRRAVARRGFGMPNEAKADLLEAAKLDPKSREIRLEFERCKRELLEIRAKEKKTYGLFFKDNIYDEKPNIRSNKAAVFLTVKVGDKEPKRMGVQLFDDSVPRTANNFRLLCTGEKGAGQKAASLHFKGTKFHYLSKGEFIQGGDIVNGDGTGGESVYGETFENERKSDQMNERGLLAMAPAGDDSSSSSSQFFISFKALPHRTGKNVVFGRVVEGLEVLDDLEEADCADDGSLKTEVTIVDCGAIASQD